MSLRYFTRTILYFVALLSATFCNKHVSQITSASSPTSLKTPETFVDSIREYIQDYQALARGRVDGKLVLWVLPVAISNNKTQYYSYQEARQAYLASNNTQAIQSLDNANADALQHCQPSPMEAFEGKQPMACKVFFISPYNFITESEFPAKMERYIMMDLQGLSLNHLVLVSQGSATSDFLPKHLLDVFQKTFAEYIAGNSSAHPFLNQLTLAYNSSNSEILTFRNNVFTISPHFIKWLYISQINMRRQTGSPLLEELLNDFDATFRNNRQRTVNDWRAFLSGILEGPTKLTFSDVFDKFLLPTNGNDDILRTTDCNRMSQMLNSIQGNSSALKELLNNAKAIYCSRP